MLAASIRAAVTTGFPTTSGGQRHSSETPTNESMRPRSAMISVALGRNEQIRTRPDSSPDRPTPVTAVTGDPPSLCTSCAFVRVVHGRNAMRYLLCRNEAIAEKYPRQPVLACPGYDA